MTQTQESPDQVSIADWLDNLIPIKRQAPAEAARREMTHTDQDRADFEAWLMTQPQFGKLDLSKEWLTTRNEKGEYARYEIDLAFAAWQAARRALVAKVPVGTVRLLSEQQQKAFEICKARGNLSVAMVQQTMEISWQDAHKLCQSLVNCKGLTDDLAISPMLDEHGITQAMSTALSLLDAGERGYPPLPEAAYPCGPMPYVLEEDAFAQDQMHAYYDLGRAAAVAVKSQG